MYLKDLILRTRSYVRDKSGKRFPSDEITDYINEGIDRLRSYNIFRDMPYVNDDADDIYYLPEEYQYALALYGASRCFAVDNDFYQEQQKRNEFENIFADMVARIESGEITISDMTGSKVEYTYPIGYVVDEYFGGTNTTDEEVV